MKKRLFILLFSLTPLISWGQEVSVDSLLQRVDSIRMSCAHLKDKDKIKSYETALALQDSVYNLMADSVKHFSSYEKDALLYRFFSCTDCAIFQNETLKLDTKGLPKYLKEHYNAIVAVREYYQCISSIEQKISSAESDTDIALNDKKNYVAIKIKTDIEKANELLNKIDAIDLSSLSEQQESFYQKISEKFTNILNKYIF